MPRHTQTRASAICCRLGSCPSYCGLGAALKVASPRYHQNFGLTALLHGAGRGPLNPMMVGGRGLGAPPGFLPVDPAALRLQQQIALQQQVRPSNPVLEVLPCQQARSLLGGPCSHCSSCATGQIWFFCFSVCPRAKIEGRTIEKLDRQESPGNVPGGCCTGGAADGAGGSPAVADYQTL